MKVLGHALHPEALKLASQGRGLRNTPKEAERMTKVANFVVAIVLVVPVALAILMQAAQIVA